MIQRRNIGPAFTDLLFLLTMGFAFLIYIMIYWLNPIAKEGTIDPPVVMLIEADWNVENDTDVDLYVRGPDGIVIYFANKDNGYITLKKDDLGRVSDKMLIDGVVVNIPRNYEVTTLTTLPDGWYTVNLHLFSGTAENVTVKVTNVQHYSIVFEGDTHLGKREETTVVSFLVEDGRVIELDQQVQHKLRRSQASGGT